MKNTYMLLAAALVLLGTIPCGVAAASTIEGDASILVAHGIPGLDLGLDPELPVDVAVDDVCLLSGFKFGEIAGPVTIAAGTYNIKIGLADPAVACSGAAVIDVTVSFAPGENATVIAHLDAGGLPTASKFVNDVSKPTRNKARLILHHVAAAPAVDVTLRRGNSRNVKVTIADVANGDQEAVELLPGNWNLSMVPAANGSVSSPEPGARGPGLLPPPVYQERLHFKPREIHLVYAVGSLQNGTFKLIKKAVPYLVLKPASIIVIHGIPGGDLGLDPDLPVDISLDGECSLSAFAFGGIVGPMWVAPGLHHVAIAAASSEVPCGEPALLEADIYIGPTEHATVIAHLTAEGTPTVSKFTNDLSRTMPGKGRIVVHHVAAAPAVDVKAQRRWDGPIGFTAAGLENGEKASAQIRPGTWELSINPAGSPDPMLDRLLWLYPWTTHLIYAVGSVDNGTFDLLVKKVRPPRPIWED